MSTAGDIALVIGITTQTVNLFGCSQEFSDVFDVKIEELEMAICKEQGIPPKPRSEIRDETILGETSEVLFTRLKQWLNQNEVFCFK